MRKIRIVHVLNTGGYSGAENVVITLINSMRDYVDGIYLSPNGTIQNMLLENNIEFHPVSGNSISVKELRKAIADIKPDIIHAHDFTAGIVAACCAGKIPVINHLHNNSPWIKRLCIKSIIYALSCYKYKRILTVSDSVMDEYIFGETFKHKIKIVGNPINLKVIRDKANEENVTQTYDVAFLGRLSTQKDPFLFLKVISEVAKRMSSLRVAIIGDGELREEVEKQISDLKLNDNVVLCGFQKNPYAILKQSKLLCMPSRWEGFGLAAVEALALGKPVVASPVGGLVNIINDSCGYLCHDKHEFVDAIYEMLKEPEIYREKSLGALKRSEDFDNIEQYRDMILGVYQSVL